MNTRKQTIPLPKGKYIAKLDVNDDGLKIEYKKRKKIALLFVCINERYWSYLVNVLDDCRKNFLPHHDVDFFVWTDMPKERLAVAKKVMETEPIEWPAPTLMRYHLFLNEEETLKDYEYIFYLDADMRVVQKVSDEIFGKALTAAPHPGYALGVRYLPPYEPNPASAAYIHRLGRVVEETNGKKRFHPFYAAGGFQGGTAKSFIAAMKVMKDGIDKDFNNNYTAIWNDESHWNHYLWEFQKRGGSITFLDPSYVYPDSLIKEYYEPLWGRSYEPKIITLTKPFTLSKQAGQELHQMFGGAPNPTTTIATIDRCPHCGARLSAPGYTIRRVVQCRKSEHQLEMVPLTA